MRKVVFGVVIVVVIYVCLGCGEENPVTDMEGTKGKYNFSIDNISGWQINKVDCRVIFSVSIENLSQTSLPLSEEMIWIEDSDNQAIYHKFYTLRLSSDAPAEILPGGRATFPISYIMGEADTFGEFVSGYYDYEYHTGYKRSKKPYKLVGLFNGTRVVVELPTWEEIKRKLTSTNPFNPSSIIPEPSSEPESQEPEVTPPSAAVDLREYIPLAVGNSWTYNRSGNIYKLFIDQTVEIKGEKYFQMKYESDGKIADMWQCFAISPDGKELWQNGPYAYIDQGMIAGQERVTVPAGTFDCIKVERKVKIAIGDTIGDITYTEWYGKSVGLVKVNYGITVDRPTPLIDSLIHYEIN